MVPCEGDSSEGEKWRPIMKYGDCVVSCAKTAEPIKMQFGMLGRVGPGNVYYMECKCPHGNGHFGGVWLIKKQCKA